MYLKNNFFILISFIFVFSKLLYAQNFGYFDYNDIHLNQNNSKINSDAVILFDMGEKYINDDYEVITKHHRRIKILTENGKKYADIRIPYSKFDEFENIEAIVRLENGKIIELDEDDIFDQSIDQLKLKVFSLKGVEVGAIIDYRYELINGSQFFLDPWHFQNDELTLKSQFKFIYPKKYKFDADLENIYGFDIKTEEKVVEDPYGDHDSVIVKTWSTENIPALKFEPFMYNLYDNYAKLSFKVKTLNFGFFTLNFSISWTNVVRFQTSIYESMLKKNSGIDTLAKSLKTDFLSANSNARTIYNYVRDYITTVDKKGFVNDSLPQIIQSQKASRKEKNLFLISLLREAGYEANLCLISTRDNGKFNLSTMHLKPLNHILVFLTVDKRHYLLDCTNKFCAFNNLPINYNVEKGILFIKDNFKIIDVFISNLDNNIQINTNAILNNTGDLNCETHIKISGIPAMIERTLINESEEHLDYIKNKLDAIFLNAEIDTFKLPNFFIVNSALDILINFTIPNYASISDSIMYFEIPYLSKQIKNPFFQKNRNFPIDYDYEIFKSEFINLKIPDGYYIEEFPNRAKNELEGFTFNSLIFSSTNSLECRRNFRLKKLSFMPEKYHEIKNLYDVMVQSDQSQVVLHKNQ